MTRRKKGGGCFNWREKKKKKRSVGKGKEWGRKVIHRHGNSGSKILRDNNETDGTEEIKDEEKMRMNRSQEKEKKCPLK